MSLVLLVFALVCIGYAGRDDAYITYFVADSIASGNGLVNYNGAPFEQSSSLLFTLVLASVSVVSGLPAPVFAPILSVVVLLVCIGLVSRFETGRPWAAVACLSASALYWALSGMENALYLLELLLAARLAAFCIESEHRLPFVGLAIVALLAALTRPEGGLVVASLGLGLAALYPRRPRAFAVLGVAVAGALAAIGLRLAAGLNVFPNPVYAKEALMNRDIWSGVEYLYTTWDDLPISAPLLLAILVVGALAVIRQRLSGHSRPLAESLLLLAGAVLCFAILSGGDWMENARFLVPALVLSGVAALLLLPRTIAQYLALALLVISFAEVFAIARRPEGGLPVYAGLDLNVRNFQYAALDRYNIDHGRDVEFADMVLSALADDPREELVIASPQGGTVSYLLAMHSDKRLAFVDMAGLTTQHWRDCKEFLSDVSEGDPVDVVRMQECSGVKIDYFFHIEWTQNWEGLKRLEALGCTEVLRQDLVTPESVLKYRAFEKQFLMRCDIELPKSS